MAKMSKLTIYAKINGIESVPKLEIDRATINSPVFLKIKRTAIEQLYYRLASDILDKYLPHPFIDELCGALKTEMAMWLAKNELFQSLITIEEECNY